MNMAMADKIQRGEAIDVSSCGRTPEGHYVLEKFVDAVDYCDTATEEWIWTIGQRESDGVILASTSGAFYMVKGYKCLFLR